MDFQYWDVAGGPAVLSTANQGGSFSANPSSHFRRPSKVVKSNSRNNSPRNTGRRRMTTTGQYPARTRSVVDYQRSSMPQLTQYPFVHDRPISWHPNTMDEMAYLQLPNQQMMDMTMASPYTVAESNGLVTPLSFPVLDEPQIQELISPLEDLSAHDPTNTHAFANHQDFSMETWLNQQQIKQQYQMSASMHPNMHNGSWYDFDQSEALYTANITASPSYPPVPAVGISPPIEIQAATETEKEELVGMGLYDSPADVQSSSLLFGSSTGFLTRKTLKLEDAFEPTATSEDDDDNDGESRYDEEEDAPGELDDEFLSAAASTSQDQSTVPFTTMPFRSMDNSDFLMVQQWSMQQHLQPHPGGWI